MRWVSVSRIYPAKGRSPIRKTVQNWESFHARVDAFLFGGILPIGGNWLKVNHHKIVGVLNEKTLRFLASLLSIITCGRHTALVEKGACKPFNFFFFFLSTLLGCIPAEKGACETENVVIFFFLLLIFIFCLSINFVTTHGWHTSGERGLL